MTSTRKIAATTGVMFIVAIILMMAACVLALFSGNRITSYIPLAFPIFFAGNGSGGLADRQRIQSVCNWFQVRENGNERAVERGIDRD